MHTDWIELFPTRSLERGCRYYESGSVCALESRKSGWRATVRGSEDYAVFVPKSMDPFVAECTCPHYEDGNICKHIAAAMLAVAARESVKQAESAPSESMEDILKRADSDELRSFLLEEATHNEKLERRIRSRFGVADVKQAKRELQKATTTTMHQHERGGFIDWRDAMEFAHDYRETVESIMEPFFRMKDADALLDLAIARLVQLQRICIDDSDGFFTDALSDVEKHLDKAYKYGDESQRAHQFDALAAFIQNNPGKDRGDMYWYEQDVLEDYLADRFAGSKAFAPKVADFADKRIAALPPAMGNDFDMNGSERRKWTFVRLKTMRTLGSAPEELLSYAEQHSLLEVSDALLLLSKTYNARRRKREAVELLRAHLGARPLYRSIARGDRQSRPVDELLRIASSAYSPEELRELYLWLLSQEPSRDTTSSDIISWYDSLRNLHEEDGWNAAREHALNAMPRSTAHTCLAHEGAREELYQSIMADGGSDLMRFEKLLSETHPQPYIDYYLKSAASQMERASDRSSYARVADSLAHAARLDGGQERAHELAAQFRVEYPRRTALRDELRAAGFRV